MGALLRTVCVDAWNYRRYLFYGRLGGSCRSLADSFQNTGR